MDSIQAWTLGIVVATFLLYIVIAILARAASTADFFVAGKGVHPVVNGMATAADWMSAASFISMAGLVSFMGRGGSAFLMGWTGGYVLLALLLAPYLRKFGKFTVPDFVGDRFYSKTARIVAVVAAIFVSFTYVCGQMQGVGIVFARFLQVDQNLGVAIGMLIVFFYAVMGGMKGITYTQVAQYCVLIFAFTLPVIFISLQLTGNPLPPAGVGGEHLVSGEPLLLRLDRTLEELGFSAYTRQPQGFDAMLNYFCLTAVLMLGTAGLPHVIVRFYTVRRVRDARASAFWALLFIGLLYVMAASVAVFGRLNSIESLEGKSYAEVPAWYTNWERTGLVGWVDKNGDGVIQYRGDGAAFLPAEGENKLASVIEKGPQGHELRGVYDQPLLVNEPTAAKNELFIDRDIMVLANPEIAGLDDWVVGLVAAGGLAAALSTAAGLLLVISAAFSHDLIKRTFKPDLSEKSELMLSRIGAGAAVIVAGYFGMNPPGFVAQVVAFAFGLAAASFFPAILLGIFSKRVNREGAVAGMVVGLLFTGCYIWHFQIGFPGLPKGAPGDYLFGIAPAGIGLVGMLLNFAVTLAVSALTPAPPTEVVEMVEQVREP